MAPRPTKKSPGLPAPQPPPRPDLALQARPPAHPDLSATPRPAAATMECMAQMMGGKGQGPVLMWVKARHRRREQAVLPKGGRRGLPVVRVRADVRREALASLGAGLAYFAVVFVAGFV